MSDERMESRRINGTKIGAAKNSDFLLRRPAGEPLRVGGAIAAIVSALWLISVL
jgi:hypothetical protein